MMDLSNRLIAYFLLGLAEFTFALFLMTAIAKSKELAMLKEEVVYQALRAALLMLVFQAALLEFAIATGRF